MFPSIVAKICQAHNEDFEWLMDKKNLKDDDYIGNYSINAQFIALLLRLGDLLDLDDKRTQQYLYKFVDLNKYGDKEWRQHYIVKNYEKIFTESNGKKSVRFYGECADIELYRKI